MPDHTPENPHKDARPKHFSLDEGRPPARLDRLLGDRLDLSRRQVRELLDAGLVHLNDATAQPGDKGTMIGPGDRVTVEPFVPLDQVFPKPNSDLALPEVAAGEGWVIVEKPARMPVRPHHADETSTVLNAIIARYPQLAGVGEGGLRSGVVHRLDTDTSGLLIIATRQRTWLELRRAFSEQRAKKTYHALVHGQLTGSERLVMHLRVARSKNAYVEAHDKPTPDGTSRPCAMTRTALETFGHATLIEVDLETGFLHQVRTMMAHAGHPLIGDRRYAAGLPAHGARRHLLHASALSIGDIRAESDLPTDMQRLLDKLREGQA